MSNSKLVTFTQISPFRNSPRNHRIDKITIHHMAGNLSVETCGGLFSRAGRNGSANYGVDSKGRVGLYVDEGDRAWTSGSRANDMRAVTIEVANDGGAPDWHVSDVAYSKLLDLVEDICRRNGIERLNFTGDARGNLTMHRYFQATSCPGPYLASRFQDIADEVNRRLAGDLHVRYQTHVGGRVFGRWLPNVTDRVDYAGNYGQSVTGLRMDAGDADLIYKVSTMGGSWLPEVKNREDYAGIYGKEIDRVMVKAPGGATVYTRVHVKGGAWLPPVTGYDENDWRNGYAGNKGQAIDAIYVWAEKGK